jgi:uncharacterized protein (TIGR00266 family)
VRYKVRFRPSFSMLSITLQPGERLTSAVGTLVSMDVGVVVRRQRAAKLFVSLLYRCLGAAPNALWVNVYHNPTDNPLKITLSHSLPGDILRLDISKSSLCFQPGVLIAHTGGIRIGIQWLGWSSWLSGEGLVGLKLYGNGRVLMGSYGHFAKYQVYQRFIVEQRHLLAYSSKLRLRVGFPKGLVGSQLSGEGLVSQLIGGGMVYVQSHSLSGLTRYLLTKFRS